MESTYHFNLWDALLRIHRKINEEHIFQIVAQLRHDERIENQKRHGYLV